MKLGLDLRATLTQTLTPQQIQYLKLLQLPMVQLEQHVSQEIEQNPMLDDTQEEATEYESPEVKDSSLPEAFTDEYEKDPEQSPKALIDEQSDPFEFYKLLWNDDGGYKKTSRMQNDDEEDNDYFQIKDNKTVSEDILEQLKMTELTLEEEVLGEQLIYNVDDDGYFRRDLINIVTETNDRIADLNFEIRSRYLDEMEDEDEEVDNPAREYAVSQDALNITKGLAFAKGEITEADYFGEDEDEDEPKIDESDIKTLQRVNYDQAEKVLKIIQSLDPPGYASRNVQECLVAQCKALSEKSESQTLALQILENTYEAFTMKHYPAIMKQLDVNEDQLKDAIEVIKRLNPKPGGYDSVHEMNTVIPDFVIERDEDTDELLISVSDGNLPVLKLNQAYEKLKKEAKIKVFNKETREWIRNKYEDAKFLIQAIKQRKNTMLKVMTAIAQLQKNFFYEGHSGLRPLIYKDVAEVTGLDISTVCRIVNGKYVQTEFGTFELKFYFSESLPSEDGEEVSTTIIKKIIKDIIEVEPKDKPYSDDKIGKLLKEKGYQIARRTVAKYREQMKIPVARLRKEL